LAFTHFAIDCLEQIVESAGVGYGINAMQAGTDIAQLFRSQKTYRDDLVGAATGRL